MYGHQSVGEWGKQSACLEYKHQVENKLQLLIETLLFIHF